MRRDVRRDTAVVLSGGGINGVLMELGFLKRLRESSLWPRIGWIIGTSAGALAGSLAALDRLADLEEFLLALQADETFRPNRLWRLPLLGLHEYALPPAIDARALTRLRKRLEKFGRVPPVRAFIAELREAEERDARGLPAHLPEMIMRLTRAAIVRNTVVEERTAAEREQSIDELRALRED